MDRIQVMRCSSIPDIELRQGLPFSPPFIPSSAIHHVTDWAFQGEWWRGARQGWGRMVYANGDYFEGEFGTFSKTILQVTTSRGSGRLV